jgi:UDP-hydrolysing UDP-N-acetyl-D-glucosamine 2-epimerase
MKRILAISGSRADYGLLEWPVKVLRESFEVDFEKLWQLDFGKMHDVVAIVCGSSVRPDCILLLGDRFEILAAAIAAHLQRVPIAHIGGGDVTLGSYDDAMRDCISRMATYHFATSTESFVRLCTMGGVEVHNIGNPAIDYIRNADWKRERPYTKTYVVVSYQAETSDGTIEQDWSFLSAPFMSDKNVVFIRPNPDAGSDKVNELIDELCCYGDIVLDQLPHAEFLNLIYHCEEFIGNSSSMLYEAPELGVKCRMIGKRQQGRVVPTGDGKASERIKEVLCRCL